MTGIFGIMRAAILADATIPALISSRVYSMRVPDDQKPPFISLAHSGNTPIRTAGDTELDLVHITLNIFVQGQDWTTLEPVVLAIRALFKTYNEQSGGKAYTIERIFDMAMTDSDGSLMWSFEYLATITDS